MELLHWLWRLEAASVEAAWTALGMGRRTGYSHLGRLQAHGLVRWHRAFDGHGSVVTVTAAGARAAGAQGRLPARIRTGTAGAGELAHARAVSWVAARHHMTGRTWLSERELREDGSWRIAVIGDNPYQRHHHPDLAVMLPGQRAAIEVELTRKSMRRLRQILTGYRDALADRAIQRPSTSPPTTRSPTLYDTPRARPTSRTSSSSTHSQQ